MGIYSSAQSNLGQAMVGMEVPVVDYDFENKTLAAAGVAALAIGAVWDVRKAREQAQKLDPKSENYVRFQAGSDQARKSRNAIIENSIKTVANGAFVTAFAFGALMDASNPYTEETINEIDSVAVVLDAGIDSKATDVQSNIGQTNRLSLSVFGTISDEYAFSSLGGNGIRTSYIAAGKDPILLGEIENGTDEEKLAIINNIEDYAGTDQEGIETGGGDIAGGVKIAEATSPDKKIIIASDLEGHYDADTMAGQAEPGVRDISIIALGTPGTEVETPFSGSIPADVNVAYHNLIVGEEDSYVASTAEEFSDIVSEIISNEIITDVRTDYDGFENVWKAGGIGLIALGAYKFLQEAGPRPIKRLKKFLNKGNQ